MKKPHTPSADPNVLAILHRSGRVWRGLIAKLNTRDGISSGERTAAPSVVATREFTAEQAGSLDAWLDEHRPARVLSVVPASAVICRTCVLPEASPEQLAQALQLQAEAHLLGIAPPHRLGMAVLSAQAGETTRIGLVLAWPDSAVVPIPPTKQDLRFVPDVAAMAALMNGHRPTEIPLYLDREDGSVALAVSHAGGLSFRATREEPSNLEQWTRGIGRIAAETALSVGHSGSFIEQLVVQSKQHASTIGAGHAKLFLNSEIITTATTRVHGTTTDSEWWSDFGIAVGALLACTGPLAAMTRMQQTPDIQQPTLIGAVTQALSKPRVAACAVMACIAMLMFGPLAINGIRYLILKARFSDVQTQLASATRTRQQVAVYQEMERQKVWSMTKLLSDLACYTPIGIELETVRVESGQEVSIGGTAIAQENRTPAQLVALMQENFRTHGLFSDISVSAGKTDNLGRYRFDLSAKVAKPFSQPILKEDMDFATKTYGERLYGEAARPSAGTTTASAQPTSGSAVTQPDLMPDTPAQATASAPPVEDVPLDIESPTARERSGTRIGGAAGANPADDPSDGGSGVDPRAVPPPLDVEQVKVMSVAELKDALSKIGKARQSRDLDKETQDRLRQEWNLVMEYLRKAPQR